MADDEPLVSAMKRTTRRSLRRAWRTLTWPISAHLALALGTGLACGITAEHYSNVIAPRYAAIAGIVLYPAMVGMWWHLHRPGR
jgi:hypothetical protein